MSAIEQDDVRAIKDQARTIGFDVVGIADPAGAPSTPERLRAFLNADWHGDMAWMENRESERATPAGLWPAVNAIVMLGMNYGPSENPLAALDQRSNGVISVYAQNKDYHDVVKKKLKALARWMIDHYGGEVKVFVDTAPVMEKPMGQAAGLGWQGKHTNLVSREKGSWLFLGAVFTTLDLPADLAEKDHCGVCSNCLDVCPTNAFPAPYKLDARRCISYLTIEHKGPIPNEFRRAMGNRIYGCDDCLAVCPWNKFAQSAQEAAFHAREELKTPALRDLAALDDAAFRALFKASPVKRVGRDRFVRNVLIAIGNSADLDLADAALALLNDDATDVRGAAVWALKQLLDEKSFTGLAQKHLDQEACSSVREEWSQNQVGRF